MEKQIVACIDDSAAVVSVCDWAAWTSLNLQAPLTLLHVLDKAEYPTGGDLSGSIGLGTRESLLEELTRLDEQRSRVALEQGKRMLEAATARVEKAGAKHPKSLQRHANLVETLAEMESQIRVVIIGRQGKKSESSLAQIGSQLESVIRTLQCPVLVTLSNFQIPRNIMIAFDGSPTSFKMLSQLTKFPQLFQSVKCHVVMVAGESDKPLQEAKALLNKEGHDCITAHKTDGPLDSVLRNYVKEHNIDLTVMGAYGNSPIRRFILGSNTTRMLQQTQVPLLLLR
jgi:nucleotide-binding universal stress UspA family protein